MKEKASTWLDKGWITAWEGDHRGSDDFFGLPLNKDPIYVAAKGGMNTIPTSLIQDTLNKRPENFKLYHGVRVEHMEITDNGKWKLMGKSGKAAYHDTSEKDSRAEARFCLHEDAHDGYDFVVLTDISSSFESWHRASAGVPDEFARHVRAKAGSRVPLFTCMVAFEEAIDIGASSLTFDSSETVWFASRTNSKPGFDSFKESWTIISTPEYAIQKISETPMQDAKTGKFLPQSPDYLLSIPGPELYQEFLRICGLPMDRKVSYLNAQRWGSALPANKVLANDESSGTRKVLSGVAYDAGRGSLAPTRREKDEKSYVCDDSIGLLQCGDMVSSYSPGFEGAVLSALEAAEHLSNLIEVRIAKNETGPAD